MRHLPDEAPVYLVAVRAKRFTDAQALVERLVAAIELPGPFVVVTLAGAPTNSRRRSPRSHKLRCCRPRAPVNFEA
jgi:hypothetical protein